MASGQNPENSFQVLGHWADQLPLPLLIVDQRRRVLYMNGAATQFTRYSDDVVTVDDVLHFCGQGGNGHLDQALARLVQGQAIVRVPAMRGQIVVRARLLDAGRVSRLFGLSFFDCDDYLKGAAADSGFQESFGLTRKEMRVAIGLGSGRSAEMVAQDLGVSLQTVRTHIRHIYSKLNVGTREEMHALMRLYLSFA